MSNAVLEMPVAPPVEDTKLSRILRWRAGEAVGPWEMQVHPTNRCNLKCKICWERRAEKEIGMGIYDRTTEVSDERYLKIVDEGAELGVREWTIVGGGEPMVRDNLVIAMCERIKKHGMRAYLHTNATRFRPEHFERLIAAGLDRIRVSIDGPTQDTNDTIRGGGFEKAVGNLRTLNEIKKAHGVTHPVVTLHPVITNVTYKRLIEIVDLANEIGGRGVHLSHLVFEKPEEEEGAIFRLTPEQQAELPRHVRKAQARARELGFEDAFDSLLPDALRSEKSLPHLGRTCCKDRRITDAACYEVWLSCIVHVTGKVGPCCVSYDDDAQNIKDMSLRDAWLGPFMQDTRRRIVTDDLPHFCAGCPTYITPRSEQVRRDLSGVLPHKDLAQWDKWAGLSAPNKALLLASRFGENLRRLGFKETLQRAWEWRQAQSR